MKKQKMAEENKSFCKRKSSVFFSGEYFIEKKIKTKNTVEQTKKYFGKKRRNATFRSKQKKIEKIMTKS